jgi:NTE family protein
VLPAVHDLATDAVATGSAPPGNSRKATPMNTAFFSTRHVAATPSGLARSDQDHSGERALVLGGGGATGNAWSIGVIAGLFDAGLDVTGADLIIGTSAGSTTAVQITGASPPELFAATVVAVPPQRPAAVPSDQGRARVGRATAMLDRTAALIAVAEDPADMRRKLGEAAIGLAAASDGSVQARWRATVASRLPGQDWPDRPVLITAVDARTGEPVVFDRHSGVDLADAVAASCSSGSAYAIGDGWYIDGGYRRSAENADLAAGYGRVLVLSPFGGRTRAPMEWGMQLAAQVDELRAGGSRVETIAPGGDAEHLFGANAVDFSLRGPAARAGHDKGRALAVHLAEFWR